MGIRKETITRWKKNPVFKAELDAHIVDMEKTLRPRLVRLFDLSLSAIEYRLNQSHEPTVRAKFAFEVLKLAQVSAEPQKLTAVEEEAGKLFLTEQYVLQKRRILKHSARTNSHTL